MAFSLSLSSFPLSTRVSHAVRDGVSRAERLVLTTLTRGIQYEKFIEDESVSLLLCASNQTFDLHSHQGNSPNRVNTNQANKDQELILVAVQPVLKHLLNMIKLTR